MIAGTYYVYLHVRADNGSVFYVGKGKDDRVYSLRGRSQYWHAIVKKHGLRIEIIEHFILEIDAFEYEKRMIGLFRAVGHALCNKTNGGEGVSGHSPSNEVRAKIGAANRGRIRSPETRAKISAGLIGRPVSAETREKLSSSQKGREINDSHRNKISATLRGRAPSKSTQAKIAERTTANPEWRAKHSAILRRPWSEARRAAQERRTQC